MKIKLLLVGTLCALGVGLCKAANPFTNITVYNFVVTAPSSPSNSFSLQNAMSYLDKGGVVGLIPTDVANNPAALNRPHMLRACDIIWSASTYYMWDATNNPTGPFAVQNGKRLGWGMDWKQTTSFLASDIYFICDSSDAAHSLHYAGNVATNTYDNMPLTFSSTLRGELWNTEGVPIAWYYNGESVVGHPVNRVMCLIREGYYASDTNALPLDLNYFKDQITLQASVQFYMLGGTNANASLSSRPWLDITGTTSIGETNGLGTFLLEGQRQLSMTYTIQGTNRLDRPIAWGNLFTDKVDGFTFTGQYYPNGFFRVLQGNAVLTELARTSSNPQPSVKISNGPE